MDLSSFYFNSSPLHGFPIEKEIEDLCPDNEERECPSGAVIFEEQAYPKGVFILKKGRVKIYQSSSTGYEQIIAIHSAGEIFGYRPILCSERYPVSAKALEQCVVLFIPAKDFHKALETSASLSNALLRGLSHEFTVWVNTVTIMARATVKERLLLNILLLAEKYHEKPRWPIRIRLPKADLACLIGTSNETLARILKVLKDEKLVVSSGSCIEIVGPDQLKRIEDQVSLFI